MVDDRIKRGYVFVSKDEKFWKALKEGYGVVVVGLGTRGFMAYGDAWDAGSFEGDDYLRKNFAGASFNYEDNVFLVTKEKGGLVWRKKKDLAELKQNKAAAIPPFKQKSGATHQRVSVVPLWKQKRFHFSETNRNVVA